MFLSNHVFCKHMLLCLAVILICGYPSRVHSLESSPIPAQMIMMGNMVKTPAGDILLDNFEYWDSPMNHGWQAEEPSYPVFGGGIGYGLIQGVLDFGEGSRVLDVYRPASVFLPFDSSYMPYTISKSTRYANGSTEQWIDANNSELSFKARVPLAMEYFDTFRFEVIGTTDGLYTSGPEAGENHFFQLVLIPIESPSGTLQTGLEALAADSVDLDEESAIQVYLGRQYQDGTWHAVTINIGQAVRKATGENLRDIRAIRVRGNQYRLDDIIFFKSSPYQNRPPYLFRIGPVFTQLFDQTGLYSTRLIFAEDPDLGLWCLDPNGEPLCYVETGSELDEPLHNTNLLNASVACYLDHQGKKRFLDGGRGDPLSFQVTVGGPGAKGTKAPYLWTRIPLFDPISHRAYDPPLLPYIPKLGAPITRWLQGRSLKDMQSALINSGFTFWPNAILLQTMNCQVLENLIVTCEVTDGRLSDMETFPLSIVNYPVTNHPPRLEQLYDQCFEVGRVPKEKDIIQGGINSDETTPNVYTVTATDPDPGDILTYSATLDGIPAYQYGPWVENIINPYTGVIAFVPQFEGVFHCVVKVQDSRGLAAFGSFNLFCVNKGTWFNHPPIVLKAIESPQKCRAGDFFTLADLHIYDPDDEKLFYSCNIGAVSENGIFTIQSHFPGQYLVEITAYDNLGGYASQQFMLEIFPWWSM
ncbi:MAG: hypothetical protein ACMUIA_07560 [bacterium]